jgi:hypothetical protein
MEIFTLFHTFALFGSIYWFWTVIVTLLILGLISERLTNGFIMFIGFSCFLVLNYFFGNFPIDKLFTLKYISLYLIIGFFFSFIKTFFSAKKMIKLAKYQYDIKYFKAELSGNVFRWITIWPLSGLYFICDDVITKIWDYTYTFISNVYDSIIDLAIGDKSKDLKE